MGWENYHLYEFTINEYRIGGSTEDFDFDDDDEVINASTVTLGSIITDVKEKFEYEYDFGDGWRHQIVVEKFLPRDSSTSYPICTDGKLNCPPEDCGGVGGFYELLNTIEDKKNPEREEMLEWLGGSYDAQHFDKQEINDHLKTLDK